MSLSVNAKHGTKRSPAYLTPAIELALTDEEWGIRSDAWIARMCSTTDNKKVGRIRKKLEAERVIPFQTSIATNAEGVYRTRTPPGPLDEEGFLIAKASDVLVEQEGVSGGDSQTSGVTSVTPGFGGGIKLTGGEWIVAFPMTMEDCDAFVALLEGPPERVVVPIEHDTSMVYEVPSRLSALVDTHELVGPRAVYVSARRRHYFVWFRGEGPDTFVRDVGELLGDGTPTFLGTRLGGWNANGS